MENNSFIYGYSDDTIVLENVKQKQDDFSIFRHPYGELYCSDGTVLEYRYNGVWDFTLLKKGTQFDRIDPWIDETVDYSDNVHFKGQLEWVNILYKTYP